MIGSEPPEAPDVPADDAAVAAAGGAHGERSAPPRSGWLTRNLLVLSGVSFLQDTASELLYPILPIFLTSVLGAPAAVVGLVEGLAEGGAAATKLLAGLLGDRLRRRPLIAVGYGLAALGKVFVAVAWAWPLVLVGRVVDRFGKGVRGAPRDALLVTGIPPSARGRAFGVHRTADTLGAVVGPLLGLIGYELLGHRIRPLLVLAVIPAVLSVLLVAAVREDPAPSRPRAAHPAASARPPGPHRPPGPLAGLPRRYWRVVALLGAFSLVNFPDALLLLRLSEVGFGVPAVIAAYVAYNAVYAAGSFPAGLLADRLAPPRVFAVGLMFFAVGYLGLGLTTDHRLALGALILYGLFAACTDSVGKAWISGLAPADRQSGAQGVFQGATGAAVLLAGVWAGLAWGDAGRGPLLFSGAVAVVLAGTLLVLPRRALVAG